MHFWYWWYWTSSQGKISFLFLPFFPMTIRKRQIKNFTSNFGPQLLEMNGEVVERVEPHIGSLQCGTKPLTPSRLLCQLCPAWSPGKVEVP
ncbi:NADH dehydrogenase [Bertholletia excelsa]